MKHQPFTILLHVALVIILAGAFVTHFFGIQGYLTLYTDAPSVSRFMKQSGPGNGTLPFSISLDNVEIDYFPATVTPMDYRSVVSIDNHKIHISMNKVGEYKGWKFYQSGISNETSTFSISYDPWGTGITYLGYSLLGIGMIGFFFQSKTSWRSLLKKYRKALPAILLFMSAFSSYASNVTAETSATLPVMQRPLAANLGKVLVYWNDRICPLQTMGRDLTAVLYGGETYKGYTAEQILSGWLFYYDQWERDYMTSHPELKSLPPYPVTGKEKKSYERLSIVNWIGSGEIFQIFPYHAVDGHVEWLSLSGRKPSGMNLEQWQFIRTIMPKIKQLLLEGKNIQADKELSLLMQRQREFIKGIPLPSHHKIEAERWYNTYVRPAIAGVLAIGIGIAALILPLYRSRFRRKLHLLTALTGYLLLIYVGVSMSVLWWISGHVPLSNGPETMMFMAMAALTGVCVCRDLTLKGSFLVVAAMSMFVASMGGRTPQIGAMMPVLASPLLSIHVMVVMVSYALFFLMTLLAIMALSINNAELGSRLTILNRIILPPAVCLLGAGIFIGAVWANQTWGRYWGWDPKETCALIMWLIYALPVHWSNRYLPMFRKEKVFNIYLIVAILSVIFTYFGANYLLSGLHSYA